MNIIYLRPSQLHAHPQNARRRFDAADVERMADSMRERIGRGQPPVVQPLIVTLRAEGGYTIVAGHLRHAGAIALGDSAVTLPCVMREYADDAAVLADIGTENGVRVDLTPGEWAGYIASRLEAGVPMHELMRQTGFSRAKFDHLIAYASLAEAVQVAIDAGELPLSAASQLARIDSKTKQAKVATQAVKRRSTLEQLRAVVDAIATPKQRKATGAAIDQAVQDVDVPATLGDLRNHAAATCRHCAQYDNAVLSEPAWQLARREARAVCASCAAGSPGSLICQQCPMTLLLTGVVKSMTQGARA